ncbi:hypothetical protein MKK63_17835 [Methylobacterium sp. J-088]|uniref:hypothetical protein n=1 Tax=unclassified Methylobacterium TaxID=2615210 RepID=UPI001FB90310|nr:MULTISPECIES: hypothetical protein [unclassified Methylobacterium]MCJ2064562.1 hypothetical protein [Methylobacterium sp. J-088]
MRAESPSLIPSARGCLVLLSLLLGASLAVRAYAHAQAADSGGIAAPGASVPSVDLGAGASLPRASAGRHHVVAGSCARAALVTFVWVGPYGSDPSLVDTPDPEDRVSYIYRGWNLGHRFATVSLNAIYFIRLAQARLSTGRNPAADDIAVKIVVPAGCDATPDTVLVAFRKQVSSTD